MRSKLPTVVAVLVVAAAAGGAYAVAESRSDSSTARSTISSDVDLSAVSNDAAHVAAGSSDTTDGASDATRTVILLADFETLYTDAAELARASDAVVRGRVLATRYVDYNEGVWTVCTVEVVKSWSPAIKSGETITIVESGGVTTEAFLKRTSGRDLGAPVAAEDERTRVRVLLDGAPLPEVGDEAIYFLADGEWDIVEGSYYDVVGAFQGKFAITGTSVNRHVPDEWNSVAYAALDGSVSELENRVKAATSGDAHR